MCGCVSLQCVCNTLIELVSWTFSLLVLGAENCLEGLTFVITGVLESLEREEAADIVKKYGGKVTTSISGRTSYIVVGEEAGESKLAKVR